MFYYFTFEDGKHTLVLDMKKNYPACEEAEVVYASVSGPQPTADHITSWQHDYEFVPGKWSHTDYNFETPSTSLIASAPKLPSVDLPQADKYEVYDYPGGYAAKSEGEADARVRQEEKEVPHNLVDGASTCRTFTAGPQVHADGSSRCGCGVGAGQVVRVDVGGARRQPAERRHRRRRRRQL